MRRTDVSSEDNSVSRAVPGLFLSALLALVLGLVCQSSVRATPPRSAPPTMLSIVEPSAALQAGSVLSPTNSVTYLPLIARYHWIQEPVFGMHVNWMTPPSLAALQDLGASWARLHISWAYIEPVNTTPDNYEWDPYFEQQLIDLSAAHIKVILLFGQNPSWAATYINGPIDLVDINELGEFVHAAAERYSRPPYNVKHWEIYNEPDCGDELYADTGCSYFGHNAQAYVDILHAVHDVIKPVDPQMRILLGGIAYDFFEEDGGPFVRNFIDEVLYFGGAEYFDWMNFHYYRAFDPAWAAYGHGILGKLAALQEVLASYGVQKPFACTESGWYSDGNGQEMEVQARYAAQLYTRAGSVDLTPVMWYMLQDATIGYKWGLMDLDMAPKPAYFAYQTVVDQLATANFTRVWTDGETGSDQIEAYEYTAWGLAGSVVVAWTNDELTRPLTIDAPVVQLVDKLGASWTVYDGQDGCVDGCVTWQLGPSPIFFRFQPGSRLAVPAPAAGLAAPAVVAAHEGQAQR